ncbi:MAG: hypothetical protein KGQ35_11970, partial [Burkholderiales bacterium]|nr:hypothetical protein [Burkholderiales bacterium]
ANTSLWLPPFSHACSHEIDSGQQCKGVGMSLGWILLVDTLAGSLIFLSLSGVILWLQTSRRRGIGLMIFGVSIVATLGLALTRL